MLYFNDLILILIKDLDNFTFGIGIVSFLECFLCIAPPQTVDCMYKEMKFFLLSLQAVKLKNKMRDRLTFAIRST